MDCTSNRIATGPPLYYRPVCFLTPWGFVGGPWRYQRADEAEARQGLVIVDVRENQETSQEASKVA